MPVLSLCYLKKFNYLKDIYFREIHFLVDLFPRIQILPYFVFCVDLFQRMYVGEKTKICKLLKELKLEMRTSHFLWGIYQ